MCPNELDHQLCIKGGNLLPPVRKYRTKCPRLQFPLTVHLPDTMDGRSAALPTVILRLTRASTIRQLSEALVRLGL